MRSTLKENREIKELRKQKFTKHNLVELSSRGLIVYLTENFPRDGQDYTEFEKKMMILKSLDTEDISHAIARMDRINHVNDQKDSSSLLEQCQQLSLPQLVPFSGT